MAGTTWGDLATWGDLTTWWNPSSTGGTRYYLESPTVEQGSPSRDPYDAMTKTLLGLTVVQRGSAWSTVTGRADDWLATCDTVFRGGRVNEITYAQSVELDAAGYTIRVETT